MRYASLQEAYSASYTQPGFPMTTVSYANQPNLRQEQQRQQPPIPTFSISEWANLAAQRQEQETGAYPYGMPYSSPYGSPYTPSEEWKRKWMNGEENNGSCLRSCPNCGRTRKRRGNGWSGWNGAALQSAWQDPVTILLLLFILYVIFSP